MKTAAFILTLLCPFALSGQNWQLIAPGHTYFYKNDSGVTMGVEIRSQRIENDNVVYRFNNSAPDKLIDKFDIGLDYRNRGDTLFYKPTIIGAEMIVKANNDVLLIDTVQKIELLLKPLAATGSDWTFDNSANIKAEVVSEYTGPVMGNSDSLKRILLSNGNEIIISKNHGIVSSHNLFPTYSDYVVRYEQVGDHRLTQRQVNDFSVGDVIHTYSNNWAGHRYRMDTVVSKSLSSDRSTVIYDVNRSNGFIAEKVTWYLSNSDSLTLPALPGELYPTGDDYMPVRAYYYHDSTGKFGIPYYHHVTAWHWSPGFKQVLAGVGNLYYSVPESEPVDSYRKLSFYKKGNKTWGTPIIVGMGGEVIPEGFEVYPNPADDWLRIEGLKYGTKWQIMDLTGKMLLEGQYSGNLNVSILIPGAYLLKVENGARRLFQISR